MKKVKEIIFNFKKYMSIAIILKIVEIGFELIIPLLISNLINKGLNINGKENIIHTVSLMIIFYVGGFICSLISQLMSADLSNKIGQILRDKLFSKIIFLKEIDKTNIENSTLITRTTNDVLQVSTGINMFIRLGLRLPILMIGSIIISYTINSILATIFLSFLIVFMIIFTLVLKYTSSKYKEVQNYTDDIVNNSKEQTEGSRIIRAFLKENEMVNKDEKIVNNFTRLSLKIEKINSLLNPTMYLVIQGSIFSFIFIGANLINKGNLLSGDIIALISYCNQTLTAAIIFINLVILLSKAFASAKRIEEILEMNDNYNELKNNKKTDIDIVENIRFDNVIIKYNNGFETEKLNLEIKKGQNIGIIGNTGSGKTTLISVLTKLYDISSGDIYINNKSIHEISEYFFQNKISEVMQNVFVFSGTIKENILFGMENIDYKEFNKALEVSQLQDFVKNKEDGLNYYIEENGKNLSGGQKQRICIARALIRNPQILILDDATSALDRKTEKNFYDLLKEYYPETIIINVSQRIRPLLNSDKIIVMEKGKILGYDTKQNLLEKNYQFKQIYNFQVDA